MSLERTATKTAYFSIISNTILSIIKWVAGYFGNSYALIADAIESTTDIFSSTLVLIGIKYSNKPADENHPYGHGRIEPLVTFAIVGFLVISASIIARQAIINIGTPHELPRLYTLFVLAGIIIWKEISYRLVIKKSIETKSSSLKADAWHHRSDAITSVAAFIGITIALIFGKGFESADDWAALFAAGFILYNCYLIFRPALSEVMDEHINKEIIDKIRECSIRVNGVLGTEKCFARKAGMKYYIDLHIKVKGEISVKEGHAISHKLKDQLQTEIPEISNILIHVEPND
ncbi:MAG: Cobalt-zinc-cadmium resistance protein [Candidatus Nomurabacteria bacterium GW2011_GWF2_35_66]|uniref:Cobalt-zinc-cadmium resistance protein n=1 Tax=Candidatus Nomurabacteria bacterium GW2011_GWE1_35_16 TaxID=1618761 RepID=A0A0G0BRU5_9BACT|nr:MAG: Cobalt-zinc-cadmium resistance protein [Candidatus Nomurabacteria bacterium GW2011_GWF1_34_20]KKP62972.1 MAG: Cobalt-zinc-cadmium resistance protein [Candidatus Nomurabacteria bacterium GW2011_GWE2_34_25]KKP66376.1 MAG: Cobalt-zinc-cadmium resistance protein [Candidatus Nomurabacteria bacterium GW2011_GWE1_35_16]KKP83184.1 MAG: Cobalt-zinc-cadmium resistance protein [Candidatus Nomurabacteria bacterium GW2011_GWF2_35_66]HAE36531.1 cation-efflux pump [Candidatus Nomurabacteria bacterium]